MTALDLSRISPAARMALTLGATGRSVYEGSAPAPVVAKRRARAKAARAARRATRR